MTEPEQYSDAYASTHGRFTVVPAAYVLLRRGVVCGPLVESPGYLSFLMRDRDGNRFYVTRPRSSEAQASVRRATESSA